MVAGGGTALVEVYRELKSKLHDDNADIQRGIDVVINSLLAPFTQIAINAGYDGEDVIERMKTASGDYGLDAKSGIWVDMLEAGIIDPTKVTRTAL